MTPDGKAVLLRLTEGALFVNYAFDPNADLGRALLQLKGELEKYEANYAKETALVPPPPPQARLAVVQSIPKGLKPPGNGAA